MKVSVHTWGHLSKGKEKAALWAAEFLVVGAADVVVAGDVEAGIGGVECGFNGGTDLVVRYEKSLESSILTWASRHTTQFFPVRLHLWHMKVDNVTFSFFLLRLDSSFSSSCVRIHLGTFIYFLLFFQLALTAMDILLDCHV